VSVHNRRKELTPAPDPGSLGGSMSRLANAVKPVVFAFAADIRLR
jgi:hypothetical protein